MKLSPVVSIRLFRGGYALWELFAGHSRFLFHFWSTIKSWRGGHGPQ